LIPAFSADQLIATALSQISDRQINLPQLLKEKKNFQSLLVFGLIDPAIERINKFNSVSSVNPNTGQIMVRGNNITFDDYETLACKVLEGLAVGKLKFKPSKTVASELVSEGGKRPRRKGASRNVRFNTGNEEQIGFIAELICYHKLCERYGRENVNWVSENASRAYPKTFATREAGSGYDIELRENDKTRFVEVKGASRTEGIYMTREEMKKAIEFPGKYDLLIVEDPLSDDPLLRYIRSPFRFKKEESLFSNSRLKVYNDNYFIRFKWEE
jgi:hypothetical protein